MKTMTVGDLIEHLKTLDRNKPILTYDVEWDSFGTVGKSEAVTKPVQTFHNESDLKRVGIPADAIAIVI